MPPVLGDAGQVILWIGFRCTATDMFGHDIDPVLRFVHGSAPWLLGAVVAAILALLARRFAHPHSE